MKTWLVTGCSSGIGRGIAEAALAQGNRVVVTARKTESVQDLVEAYPDTAYAVALDITDSASIDAALEKAHEKFGGIDVLMNNAGHGYTSKIEEGDPNGVAELFQTNFFGPIELIKKVLPEMRARKSGAIMGVTSIAANRSVVASGYYAASKAAFDLVLDGLYKEVTPLGIKVMIVEPGGFRTHFYDTSMKGALTKIDYTDGKPADGNAPSVADFAKKKQMGDPKKAGKLIVEMIEKDIRPKRLMLGTDAVNAVSLELATQMKELWDWANTSALTNADD